MAEPSASVVALPSWRAAWAPQGLRTRLALAFGLLLALLVGIAAIGALQLRAVEQRLAGAAAEGQQLAAQGRAMHDHVADAYLAVLLATMVEDPEDLRYELGALSRARQGYREALGAVFGDPATAARLAAERQALDQAEAELKPLLDSTAQRLARAAADAGAGYERDAALQVLVVSSLKPLFDRWRQAIAALDTAARGITDEAAASARRAAAWARLALGAAALMAIVIGTIAAWRIARGITGPLQQAVGVAGRVARGDLSQPVAAAGGGETGRLLLALDGMQGGLQRLVATVRESATTIDHAAGDVAAGHDDLSRRTERAAAELQRTAAASARLAGGVHELTSSAQSARRLTGDVATAADAGGAVMAQALGRMAAITRSSARIAEIVSVIDNIAFRTNILALNAAVEAAGAGEHGRGFAVVAGEVRGLSKGVADAAKDIRRLIEDAAAEVAAGQAQVQDAGAAMQGIVTAIGGLSQLVAGIADAVLAQDRGLDDVNRAVQSLDQMTQQNAALVEQGAAAAAALREQARQLGALVAQFRLHADPHPAPAAHTEAIEPLKETTR